MEVYLSLKMYPNFVANEFFAAPTSSAILGS